MAAIWKILRYVKEVLKHLRSCRACYLRQGDIEAAKSAFQAPVAALQSQLRDEAFTVEPLAVTLRKSLARCFQDELDLFSECLCVKLDSSAQSALLYASGPGLLDSSR